MTERLQLGRKLDEVSYEAQRIIMDENISEYRKDFLVDRAVKAIKTIGEQRQEYKAQE